MARMTVQLFREILEAAESDIETLEVQKTVEDAEDTPTQEECAAIERVQEALRKLATSLKTEIR